MAICLGVRPPYNERSETHEKRKKLAVELDEELRAAWPPEDHGQIMCWIADELEVHVSTVSRLLKEARTETMDDGRHRSPT